jgi:predicted N-acetyltransferase YhbS
MSMPSTSRGKSAAPLPAAATSAPTFRHADPADDHFVEELQSLAFGPGRFARTAFRVRERFPIDRSLSLIAAIDGVPVSSVWMTPISVGGINGYLLGPLATDPKYRGLGAGKMLVRETCREALARGEGQFVLLVGDEPYYGPLGFSQLPPYAVTMPGPADPRRVLVAGLAEGVLEGLSGAVTSLRDKGASRFSLLFNKFPPYEVRGYGH